MAAVHLYWGLLSRGGWLRAEGGTLRVHGPEAIMTPALQQALIAGKADLLRLLGEPCPCAPCVALDSEPPALRLHCASGLDLDPNWVAVRREFDAQDEAAERAAIQAEACS